MLEAPPAVMLREGSQSTRIGFDPGVGVEVDGDEEKEVDVDGEEEEDDDDDDGEFVSVSMSSGGTQFSSLFIAMTT